MAKFMLLQAIYCVTGILFFVRDLFANVPMGTAMIRAFLWPYAQWLLIKAAVLQNVAHVISLLPH